MTTTSHRTRQTDPSLAWDAISRGFLLLFFLGGFIHFGLALFDPEGYRPFADGALFDWVNHGWQNIFMADPRAWALMLSIGEFLLTALLLIEPRLGYLGVIAFHLALMLFGWGFWLWCLPALAFAVPAAVHALRDRVSLGFLGRLVRSPCLVGVCRASTSGSGPAAGDLAAAGASRSSGTRAFPSGCASSPSAG